MNYQDFITTKRRRFQSQGAPYESRNEALFPFQRDLVQRALDKGRYAIFADCGLGKSLMELEWASNVPGRVLILAPIAVSYQIRAEAKRFGYAARIAFEEEDRGEKITVSNYEKLHRFDPTDFEAVVLDESSILKAYDGKTKARIIDSFRGHRFKLAATATPAPNDFMELGNHAEFVGAMTRAEMLSMFFVHDGGSTQDWRLKGHARRDFWRWVGSWSSMLRSPADMGYDSSGYDLPPLRFHHVVVESQFEHAALIPGMVKLDLNERRRARRSSLNERVAAAAALPTNGAPWLFWCDLNDESAALTAAIPGAVEVKGADTEQHKRAAFMGFADGGVDRLITKASIGGWGMNWQRCADMAFVGLSDSYEQLYQATRRCWRFGQTRTVNVHLIYSEHERAVIDNVLSKEAAHREMQDALIQEVLSA